MPGSGHKGLKQPSYDFLYAQGNTVRKPSAPGLMLGARDRSLIVVIIIARAMCQVLHRHMTISRKQCTLFSILAYNYNNRTVKLKQVPV